MENRTQGRAWSGGGEMESEMREEKEKRRFVLAAHSCETMQFPYSQVRDDKNKHSKRQETRLCPPWKL